MEIAEEDVLLVDGHEVDPMWTGQKKENETA